MENRLSLPRCLLHLFFPHTCAGCGTDLLAEQMVLCIYCVSSLPVTLFEFHCGNPIEKIFWGRASIESAGAHLYFTSGSPIQHCLHLLKYKGRKDLGIYFGRQMGRSLKKSMRFDCDLIIPLPLFAARKKERGYNQAALLAAGIGQILGIPALEDAVLRIKKTQTQTRKNRMDRWKNMESTFAISNPGAITGKHVLLVDDVVTTGATLEACAQVLLSVPGVRISIACLAHTISA